MAIFIRQAETGADLAAVRVLCLAYRRTLLDRTAHIPGIVDHHYPQAAYRRMIDALPGQHVPPDGILLVAVSDDRVVACGMTQRIDAETCELKRVFVAAAARGQGAGRLLCQTALTWAQGRYRRMVLDTLRALPEAADLYRSMGFRESAPYHPLLPEHEPYVLFFEKSLAA